MGGRIKDKISGMLGNKKDDDDEGVEGDEEPVDPMLDEFRNQDRDGQDRRDKIDWEEEDPDDDKEEDEYMK